MSESESNSSVSTTSTRRSIAECVGDMYLDEKLSDIHFSFPKEKSSAAIPAHKMILVAKSPVFKAMFCGDLAERGSTVKITDISPKIFRLMLKHIYTDKLLINADNVSELLHASQKYQLDSLTADCESYLNQNLSLHNACTILQQASDFSLYNLTEEAHGFMCKHATDIINSEDFLSLSQDNLRRVLECGGFATDEILIFKAVMKWVDTRVEEESTSVSAQERKNTPAKKRKADTDEPEKLEKTDRRRELLGDVLYQIRFVNMSVDEFNETVIPSGILTEKEQLTFLRILSRSDDSSLPLIEVPDEFETCGRNDIPAIMLREVAEKLPGRGFLVSLPKHLRNCARIHIFSSKPYKICLLNIVPLRRDQESSPVQNVSVLCQIKGTQFSKKANCEFTEYRNCYVRLDHVIKANKAITIEVMVSEDDNLFTNKTETEWEELDSTVPILQENWISKDISTSQTVKIACEGIDIVQDITLYPVNV